MVEAVARYSQYLELAAEFVVTRYGLSEEACNEMQLGVVEDPFPAHRSYHGRLCLPYLDASGTPRALKYRCMCTTSCENHPKYLTDSPGARLYNVRALVDQPEATTLYVTEGEFDAAVLYFELGLPAVGYPGTGNWDDLFKRAIGPDWDRIVVIGDNDLAEHQAGQKSAAKVAKALKGEVLLMPPGEDVSSWYVKKGREGLLEVLGIEETTEPM
jgi:DNA primase